MWFVYITNRLTGAYHEWGTPMAHAINNKILVFFSINKRKISTFPKTLFSQFPASFCSVHVVSNRDVDFIEFSADIFFLTV